MRISHDDNNNVGISFSVNYRQVELGVFVLFDQMNWEIGSRGYIVHDGDGICGWFGPGERFTTLEGAVVTIGEAIMRSLCYS